MVSQDIFEAASKAQAQVLGMPDLQLVIAPQTKPGDSREKLQREAEEAYKKAVEGLTKPLAQPAAH